MKTPVLESLFKKIPGLKACNFIRKKPEHRCFPVKFAKFLRAPFFTEHLRWLLLRILNTPEVDSKKFLENYHMH